MSHAGPNPDSVRDGDGPANPNEHVVRSVKSKLVHAPRLLAWAFFLNDLVRERGRGAVDILAMEVKTERRSGSSQPSTAWLR